MRKLSSTWNRLAVAAVLLLAGTGAALANSIAVPPGPGGPCPGSPNTSRFAGSCGSLVTIAAAPAPAAKIGAPSPVATIATTSAATPAPVRIVARPARQRTPAASAPARLAEAVRGAEVTPQVIAAIDFENGAAGSPADRPARISEADFESGDLAWKQTGLK